MCYNLFKHHSSPERDAGVGGSGCRAFNKSACAECECLYEMEECGVIQHISFLQVPVNVFAFSKVQCSAIIIKTPSVSRSYSTCIFYIFLSTLCLILQTSSLNILVHPCQHSALLCLRSFGGRSSVSCH